MDAGGEIPGVRVSERSVVFVEPGDGQFQAAAGVEAGGAGIGTQQYFRFGGSEMNFGPFGF